MSLPCQSQTKPETQQPNSKGKLIPFYLQQKDKNGKPSELPEIIAEKIALKP